MAGPDDTLPIDRDESVGVGRPGDATADHPGDEPAGLAMALRAAVPGVDKAEGQRAAADLFGGAELHRAVIAAAMDGFLLLDPRGGVLEANDAYCRMSGFTPAELLAMRLEQLGPAQPPELLDARLDRARHRGYDRFETRHRRRDGSWLEVEVSICSVAGGSGVMAAFLRDITPRKHTDTELARARAWHECEQAIRLAIASMARPGDLCRVVDEIAHQLPRLGVSPHYSGVNLQVVNSDFSDFVSLGRGHDPQARLPLWPLWTQGINWRGDGVNNARYPWVTQVARRQQPHYQACVGPDGGMPVGMSVLDVPFSHGTLAISHNGPNAFNDDDIAILSRVAGVVSDGFQRFLDLLEHRRAERDTAVNLALERVRNTILTMQTERDWVRVVQRVKEELNPLMDLGACSVCVVDRPAGTTTFYMPDQSPGRQFNVYHRLFPAIEHAMETGEAVVRRTADQMLQWGDGHIIEDVGALADVPFAVGTLGALVPPGQDLADDDIEVMKRFAQTLDEAHRRLEEIRWRQRAEQELTEQRLRAFEADRLHALGEMASGVAHELNQPLNGIRTFAEGAAIAIERGWGATQTETLQVYRDIVEQVDRMTAIIDHMRVFARGPERNQRSFLHVNESVGGAMKLLGVQLRVHGITVEQQLAADLPTCPGSQNEIEQVVINLLSNARDALDDRLRQQRDQDPNVPPDWRPRIVIRTTGADGAVRLVISDNGGGIPEAVVGQVFDPFFTTKPVGKGTGIGLAIVRGIVERHHGSIAVDNRPGDGVGFVVVLPAGLGLSRASAAGNPTAADPTPPADRPSASG